MKDPSIITVTLNPTFDRVIEVPGLQPGLHLKGQLRSRLAAGKAINVARALAKLGRKPTATGWVGRDDRVLFEEAMQEAGVGCAFVPIEDSSRENITLIDTENGVETHIRDAGPSVTPEDIERLQGELHRRVVDGSIVVFTGSACRGFSREDLGRLIEECHRKDARVAVDASGEMLREAARHALWLIKPNHEELEELAGHRLPHERDLFEQASDLARHCRHVVITRGAAGALVAGGSSHIRGHLKMDPALVRSTVGCGDAFLAGYIHGLCLKSREDDETALRYGLVLGSLSATQEQPAQFDPDLLDSWLARVTIERVDQGR